MPPCDCRRLVQLLAPDEDLPAAGHVCMETCQRSCFYWLHENWPLPVGTSLVGYESKIKRLQPLAKPVQMGGSELVGLPKEYEELTSDDPLLQVHVYLTGKNYAVCSSPRHWPIFVAGSDAQLMLVIRSHFALPTDEVEVQKLIRTLETNENWRHAVKIVRDFEWRKRHLHPAKQITPLRSLQELLASYGIPATTDTARYLAWRIKNEHSETTTPPVWPTRGGVVTTFCLSADPYTEEPLHGFTLSRIEYSGEWGTDELGKKANQIARKHTKWWSSIPLASLSRGDLRQHNRRTAEDEYMELVEAYLREEITDKKTLNTLINQVCDEQSREQRGYAASPKEKERDRRKVWERIRRRNQSR